MSNRPEGVARLGSPSRAALLVLGMHRSGTSALARMLSLLGAALPEHVLGAQRGNEAGLWEPERLVDLHAEMLSEAGSRWDDWRRFEPAALGPERLSHYRSTLAQLIAEEYRDAPLFVLKDPRLCRFIPLYEEILEGMGVTPRFIMTYRNPVSVLDSLATRDDMTASFASLVLLRHVLDAEEATRGKARVFLAYEEYLDDWRAVAARISAALGLDWPRSAAEAEQEIDAFLSRDLQYHAATLDDLAADERIGQAVRDTFGALVALTANDSDAAALETLSRVKAQFESSQPFFADAMFEEMTARQNREQRDREHLQRLVAKHEGLVAKYQGEARKYQRDREHLQRLVAKYQGEVRKDATAESDPQARLALTELSKEKTALVSQLADLRDTAAAQATEIGQLASKRNALNAKIAALGAERAALRAELAESKKRSSALEAELAALRKSTSWRLTMPLRVTKQLATDPRGAIALLRARGSDTAAQAAPDMPEQSAAHPGPFPPVIEAPPLSAAKEPLPGTEGLTPTDVARVTAAFDADFYLKQYPDVAAKGVDPFEHYMKIGWKAGRDPSPNSS